MVVYFTDPAKLSITLLAPQVLAQFMATSTTMATVEFFGKSS
ncbi:MAG: hypothetical protein ACSHWW_14190 [Nonlabens sp.]